MARVLWRIGVAAISKATAAEVAAATTAATTAMVALATICNVASL